MVKPNEVAYKAMQVEEENYLFRSFLKDNADPDELDMQFKRLHQELFSEYDCSQCRNCCKLFRGTIPKEDIKRDAKYLGLSETEFKDRFFEDGGEGSYQTKNQPCDFLDDKGSCMLGDCKPESCSKYPYTDQPDRWEAC